MMMNSNTSFHSDIRVPAIVTCASSPTFESNIDKPSQLGRRLFTITTARTGSYYPIAVKVLGG